MLALAQPRPGHPWRHVLSNRATALGDLTYRARFQHGKIPPRQKNRTPFGQLIASLLASSLVCRAHFQRRLSFSYLHGTW